MIPAHDCIFTPDQDVKLIGISGHAGAGKDTLADMIANYVYDEYQANQHEEVWVTHFAEAIKIACDNIFTFHYDNEDEDELGILPVDKNKVNSFWKVSPREVYQYFGTEIGRKFGEDIWIKVMYRNIWANLQWIGKEEKSVRQVVIIPDVRFPNECKWIYDNHGIIIKLNRDGANGNVGIANHESEKHIDDLPANLITTNNGTKEELFEFVKPLIDMYLND